MRFSDFVQLMHRYIGCSEAQQEYVLYLTNFVIRDPMTDDEKSQMKTMTLIHYRVKMFQLYLRYILVPRIEK